MQSRLKLLLQLTKIFYDRPRQRHLAEITASVLALYEQSNRLAHGDWVWINKFDGKGARLCLRTYRRGVEKGAKIVSPAQIRTLRRGAEMTARKLSEFSLRHPPAGSLPRRLLVFLRHREKITGRTGL
jgi:hypothetical protein